jgi:hypothetical protein
MPSFIGQALGSVSRTLQDAGFRLGNVSVAVPAAPVGEAANPSAPGAPQPPAVPPAPASPPAQPSPASLIVSQGPVPGQKVFAGTAISFEVR